MTQPSYSPDAEDLGLDEFFAVDVLTRDLEITADTERLNMRRVHGDHVEVWLRAAHYYPWLLKEAALSRFIWSEFETTKMGRTPYDFVRQSHPIDARNEFSFIISDDKQARRYESANYVSLDQPSAVYPVWSAKSDPRKMLRLCERYTANGWDRIVVDNVPSSVRKPDSPFVRAQVMEWLYRVNNEFPHVKMHYRGAKSFRWAFGMSFYSVDLSPLENRFAKNYVTLPNGQRHSFRALRRHLKWVHVLGYSTQAMLDPHNRLRFNVSSMLWAAENWNNPHGISSTVGRKRDDPLGLLPAPQVRNPNNRQALLLRVSAPVHNPDRFPQSSPRADDPWAYSQPISNRPYVAIHRNPAEKDKIACNSCSLANTCRIYREGDLCGKEESPMTEIVKAVGSRNADVVRTVLARIVEAQVSRLERSARLFEADDQSDVLDLKRSKRLSEMETAAIRSTETLLKIVDPEYRDSSIPAIKVGSTINVFNPRVLVADVMKAMEAEGFDRSQVDPKMIMQAIESHGVIEGEVVDDQG